MAPPPTGIEVWKSFDNGLWYWHLKDKNNKIIAHGEGYASKGNAKRALRNVMDEFNALSHDDLKSI